MRNDGRATQSDTAEGVPGSGPARAVELGPGADAPSARIRPEDLDHEWPRLVGNALEGNEPRLEFATGGDLRSAERSRHAARIKPSGAESRGVRIGPGGFPLPGEGRKPDCNAMALRDSGA